MSEILGIIQLIAWIATIVGFYYKMRNDINLADVKTTSDIKAAAKKARTDNEATCVLIRLANERIEKIEQDRNNKWEQYGCDQKEQNNKLNEIVVGVKGIQTDMKWMKNKNSN